VNVLVDILSSLIVTKIDMKIHNFKYVAQQT
jgi:hypothetical protein